MALGRTTVGIGSAVLAGVIFSFNDMVMKLLSDDYALHQLVLLRALIGGAVIVGVLMPLAGGLHLVRTRRLGAHLLRGLFVVGSNVAFFLALAAMPLAEAVAVFFVAPLLITAFSVVFLGERVGPRRWTAVAVGLVGVVVMLRPGTAAFQPAALLCLASAALYAGMHMFTRRMGATEAAVTFALYVQVMFAVTSAAVGLAVGDGRFAGGGDPSWEFLLRAWVWPRPADWWLIAAIGAASGLGGFFLAQAYRLVDAGLAAPFEYVSLPMAVLWGIVVFGEFPDAWAWTGIALIAGAGLYMMARETQLARRGGDGGRDHRA
jgi:drug/metabolite transporter (DMT)-like permease